MSLEQKLIAGALKKISTQTGLECKLIEAGHSKKIAIKNRDTSMRNMITYLHPCIVPHVTSQNIEWALGKFDKDKKDMLLITRYLTFVLTEMLFQERIQFMDLAGNCFLNSNNIFIYSKGNRLAQEDDYREKKNVAFSASGAIIVLFYQSYPGLTMWPVRHVAQIAKVSKATVSLVNRGLEEFGFLERTKDEVKLVNREKLVERWQIAFNEKLCAKLLIGRYKSVTENFWSDIKIGNEIISGEAGAQKYLTDFEAKSGIIYSSNADEFIIRNKLIPSEDGKIEIRKKFWDDSISRDYNPIDLLLIYADLMGKSNDLSYNHITYLRDRLI